MFRGESFEIRARPKLLFLLLDVESPLRQIAGFACRFDPRLSLFQCVRGVAHLDAQILLILHNVQLRLAQFQFGAELVGARQPIAQRNLDLYLRQIIGRSVVKRILQSAGITRRLCDGIRRRNVIRIRRAAKTIARVVADQIHGGQHEIVDHQGLGRDQRFRAAFV